jgi:hypothetical protein
MAFKNPLVSYLTATDINGYNITIGDGAIVWNWTGAAVPARIASATSLNMRSNALLAQPLQYTDLTLAAASTTWAQRTTAGTLNNFISQDSNGIWIGSNSIYRTDPSGANKRMIAQSASSTNPVIILAFRTSFTYAALNTITYPTALPTGLTYTAQLTMSVGSAQAGMPFASTISNASMVVAVYSAAPTTQVAIGTAITLEVLITGF